MKQQRRPVARARRRVEPGQEDGIELEPLRLVHRHDLHPRVAAGTGDRAPGQALPQLTAIHAVTAGLHRAEVIEEAPRDFEIRLGQHGGRPAELEPRVLDQIP